ncbi:hypothetical protein HY389_00200 [Candidatus Daviesbacteria bacterium]|nr:hypothetical protein [Candidatus Daviesbacteria bacterium]
MELAREQALRDILEELRKNAAVTFERGSLGAWLLERFTGVRTIFYRDGKAQPASSRGSDRFNFFSRPSSAEGLQQMRDDH